MVGFPGMGRREGGGINRGGSGGNGGNDTKASVGVF